MLSAERLDEIIEHLRCRAGDPERAAFVYADSRSRVIGTHITAGGTGHIDLPWQMIVQYGLDLNANRLVMIHTHPSGNPQPSGDDMRTTRLLCARMRRQGQRLVDHIILTEDRYFSFRANRLL